MSLHALRTCLRLEANLSALAYFASSSPPRGKLPVPVLRQNHQRVQASVTTTQASREIRGGNPSARPLGSRLRSITTVLLGVALFAWGVWWQLFCLTLMKRFNFFDFGRFYYGARGWREGGSFYDPSIATWLQLESDGMHLWNLNPPHVSAAFLPLTYFSVDHAYAIYVGLTFFALVISAQLIIDALGFRLTPKRSLLLGTFALAATPTLSFCSSGNLTGVVTLLVTLLWRAWRLGAWRQLAIWLGLACSLKVFFGLFFVYFAFERRWKLLTLSTMTTLVCFATGVLLFGLGELVRWIEVTKAIQWPWLAINSSIAAPLTRIAFMAGGQSVTSSAITMAMLVAEMIAIPLVGAGLWAAFHSSDRDLKALLLLLTILLTFPLGWLYYWWMLAGPLVACRKYGAVRLGFAISLIGWLLPMFMIWPWDSTLYALTVGSVYFWAILSMWIGAISAALSEGVPKVGTTVTVSATL
jgi:hypothetical protein